MQLIVIAVLERAFKHLDDGSSFQLADVPFMEAVKEEELKIFGVATPPCQIMVYQTGSKMLFDGMRSTLRQIIPTIFEMEPPDKLLSDLRRNRSALKSIYTIIVDIKLILLLIPEYLRVRLVNTELAKLVLGQYDLIELVEVSKEELRIADNNIHKWANGQGDDYEIKKRYVLIHEEIHNLDAQYYGSMGCQIGMIKKQLAKTKGRKNKKMTKEDKDEALAFAAAVEGRAEFFTGLISKELLPNFVYEQTEPNFLRKLYWKIIGIEKLTNNYVQGPIFIQYLYDKGGIKLANIVFEKPPISMKEIDNPELYLQRIGAS